MTQHETARITRVEQKVDDLIDSVKEIRDALIGNDYNGDGLVKRIERIETKQRNTDRIINMGMGVVAVFGFLYAIVQLFK